MLKENNFLKDIVLFILIFIISVFFAYFTTPQIKNIFFIFTLFLFYKSKKNYFWIVYAFALTDYIGYFFFFQLEEIITIGKARLSYLDLFALTAFLKTVNFNYRSNNIFKNLLSVYLLYVLFLLIIGLIYGLSDLTLYYNLIKMMILSTLFFSTQRLIKEKSNDVYKIANLLFIALFINFIGQLYYIINLQNFNTMLGGYVRTDLMGWQGNQLIRPISGFYILFLSFFFAVFFNFSRYNIWPRYYLTLIEVVCFLSVFISATRGWFISIMIIFILLFIYAQFRYKLTLLKLLTVILLMFVLAYSFNETFQRQIDDSWLRLETLKLVLQGDPTAGGTDRRISVRTYPVMEKFSEKPIFGWGFSETGLDTNDIHIGNQSLLMSGGIVGFIIMIYILFSFFRKIFSIKNYISSNNPFKKSIIVLIIFLVGLIIIHSTSTQIFGYLTFTNTQLDKNKFFFIQLLIICYNILIIKSVEFEILKRKLIPLYPNNKNE